MTGTCSAKALTWNGSFVGGLIQPDDVREMLGREHSGFSPDAAVCGAHDHAGLERLLRHRARPAFALERLDAAPIERILSHSAEAPRPPPDRPRPRGARLGVHPGREPDPCLAPICWSSTAAPTAFTCSIPRGTGTRGRRTCRRSGRSWSRTRHATRTGTASCGISSGFYVANRK
jgi:hypothetical protein